MRRSSSALPSPLNEGGPGARADYRCCLPVSQAVVARRAYRRGPFISLSSIDRSSVTRRSQISAVMAADCSLGLSLERVASFAA